MAQEVPASASGGARLKPRSAPMEGVCHPSSRGQRRVPHPTEAPMNFSPKKTRSFKLLCTHYVRTGPVCWRTSERLPLTYLMQQYLNMDAYPPQRACVDDEDSCSAALAICPLMTHTLPDAPFMALDQILVYKTYSAGTGRNAMREDDDLLTPEETRQD